MSSVALCKPVLELKLLHRMNSFTQIANAILEQSSSKWHVHERRLQSIVGSSAEELDTFIVSVRKGGSGAAYNNTYEPNPEPHNVKINLESEEDNILNLHYTKKNYRGSKEELDQPSLAAIDSKAKYFQFGKLSDENETDRNETYASLMNRPASEDTS